MIEVETIVKLDIMVGQLNLALYEHTIHEALREAGLPVVEVEVGAQTPVDQPIGTAVPAPFDPQLRYGPLGPQRFGRQT